MPTRLLGNADRRQVADGTPQLEAHVDACAARAERVQPRSREVQLSNDRGGLGDRAPPGSGCAGCGTRLGDEELRLGAASRESLNERQDVGAVTRVARPPGRRALGAEELVQADDRRRAAGDTHGVLQYPCRRRRDRARVGGPGRRADGPLERHVPEGELRTAAARIGGGRVVREGDRQARAEEESPERHPLVPVVDPGGLRLWTTGWRRRACRRRHADRSGQREDQPGGNRELYGCDASQLHDPGARS